MLVRNLKRKTDKSAVFEIAVLVIVAYGMILSDCFQFFGSWITSLKYVALGVMAIYLFSRTISEKTDLVRAFLALLGLAILILETQFQSGISSTLQAIGLFCLVAYFAILGDKAFHSYQAFLCCGIACSLLIGLLLLLSYQECITQMTFYLTTGRARLKGCFSNANSLGHISAVVFSMVIIGRIKVKQEKKGKFLSNFSLVLSAIFIILSGSRTALACVIAFVAFIIYHHFETGLSSKNARFLARLILTIVVVIAFVLSYQYVEASYVETGRVIGWSNLGSFESFVGYGYASSTDVSSITSVAGGNVEMLWMSAYYRVGIIGIAAYALIFLAAIRRSGKCGYLFTAFVVFLALQSIGESYMTSVMSFPSLFGWLSLAGLASLGELDERGKAQTEATE